MFDSFFNENTPQYIRAFGLQSDFFADPSNDGRGLFTELTGTTPLLKKHEVVSGEDYMLALGCSFTVGMGVPEGEIWSTRLAKMLDVKCITLASVGWSAFVATQNAMTHIRKYGKPKYIVFLVPVLLRAYMPLNQYMNKVRGTPIRLGHYINFTSFPIFSSTTTEGVKYAKRPFNLQDVLSPEIALYQSVTALMNFIDFCDAAKIPMVWGTWDKDTADFYRDAADKIGLYLGNVVNTSNYYKEYEKINLPEGCHKIEKQIYGNNFYVGSDNGQHSGVHQHAHWAEDFYKTIKELERK